MSFRYFALAIIINKLLALQQQTQTVQELYVRYNIELTTYSPIERVSFP
jgi:hypothetical protein